MAQISKNRSRILRAGLLSASVLAFLPVFNLVRQQTPASATAKAAAEPAVMATPAPTTRSLQRDQTYSPYQNAPSQTTPSQGSQSQARSSPSHARTRGS